MAEKKQKKSIAISRNKFILIIVLIIVFIGIAFVAISKSTQKNNGDKDLTYNEDNGIELGRDIEGAQVEETDDNRNSEEVSDEDNKETESIMSGQNGNNTTYDISKWKANDYKKGDIEGVSYTVVWGDTLWEIAEARYGSGYKWVDIYNANKSEISFLPNGNPLIIPGQVLNMP